MSWMELLGQEKTWEDFYAYRLSCGHMTKQSREELEEILAEKSYVGFAEKIRRGQSFPPPIKKKISKIHTEKKRIVYTFPPLENWTLKVLTWLLVEKLDEHFSENLYSFRPRKGVRDGVRTLTKAPDIRNLWSYKIDISNYFNSVPVEQMLLLLGKVLEEEPETYEFLEALLRNPLVEDQGQLIEEQKGIMAGVPTSSILANLYLAEMDREFQEAGILYARYSDDIIFFAKTEEERERWIGRLHEILQEKGLTVNPKKEARTAPGEKWTFLGISYQDGVVDVSRISVDKLKAKMRRKTRALVRWQAKKGASGEQAAKAFVRVFHRKLYENPVEHELTWTRWYFPLINTADSLKEIDQYMQSCIRYLATGKRTKAAYDFRYEDIGKLGYESLVHNYYKEKK